MRLAQSLYGLFSLSYITSAGAVSLHVRGRRDEVPTLVKRDDAPNSLGNGSVSLQDMSDTLYFSNITLNGLDFEVSIDTGSADLWVVGNVPRALNTSVHANLTYGRGSVAGFVNAANLVFDDFEIENQVYVHADAVIEMPGNSGTGMIGLGPSKGSLLRFLLENSTNVSGDPPLDRIFQRNTTTPNVLTILLGRDEQYSTTPNTSNTLVPLLEEQSGQITIGEVIPEYEKVTQQAKLPALVDSTGLNQHWMTVLNSNGIIGPDGKQLNTTSTSEDRSQGKNDQLRVVFDSGFTFPQVPAAVSDAFYGRVPGASFNTEYNLWQVPCDYELNVSFILANNEYPIHPLDLTVLAGLNETTGEDICAGWFQPIAESIADSPAFGAFDAILGVAFLRSTYLLIDFGDFVDNPNSSVADPYIQLLSTVNRTAAHMDFVDVRLGGKDITGFQKPLLSPKDAKTSGRQSQDLTKSALLSDQYKPVYHRIWFIVVVSVAGAIVLASVVWIVYMLTRRARRSKIRSESAFVPPIGSYRTLVMRENPGLEVKVTLTHHSDYESGSIGYRSDSPFEPPMGSYKPSVMKDDSEEIKTALNNESGSSTGYHDPYSDNPRSH
ncbi:hypothetical protein GYMLUDRAFT_961605 [Collybiopsis luxurians FD-317 M1]|nr:hypothetical protein GYMLUDRAFT_961605 [Collybiopsis luxurians FD-317 M1]